MSWVTKTTAVSFSLRCRSRRSTVVRCAVRRRGEGGQRLVAKQEIWCRNERLRLADKLLLTARERADATVRNTARADKVQHFVGGRAVLAGCQLDEVANPNGQ